MPLTQPLSRPQSLRELDSASVVAHPCDANAWFGDRFGVALPRGLREQAGAMPWESFLASYGQAAGPLRIGHWKCADIERPTGRLGAQARNFRAMIAIGDCISTSTAAASGPIAALTAMLHERGIAIETLNFHQMASDGCTATFICGSDGIRAEWAMGLSEDPIQSALRALITCANRLMA
ncbi:hypothetical protein NJB14197_22230 [Mycobacterium montefiorense]|uniref:Homocitrate synthase n=1 Tax=Mycobacterium montefiorense TaxID=154654 RepID=A0AA37PMI1_9MYCO|nr:homocitrate synthase [Mycobacterium montefiorense]GBG36510.1 hypothetical protein MmonteBS_08820 [Mycobacterium montefiorense]GKU37248.1 hypothetical protein NJB14191_45940 [Mycobacterium montefiorense]GKU43235.1 hypothetical protein NJB14192_52180 [Mycobacterium montefiorense]GKU44030.1 hypothetical protein NJB14194_06620 [Mycobacterium montefiorense]GKU53790.1 hypothetical protein NJB14195_50310 [Mycobacterium montefiorense]